MGNSDTTVIAVACDDNYAPYAATVLASAAKNIPSATNCSFVVATFGLSDVSRRIFAAVSQLTGRQVNIIEIENRYSNFPAGIYTSSMYIRFELPDRLPNSERILYLDCDVLVRKDLTSLLERNLGESVIGAIADYADLCGGPFIAHKESIGIHSADPYFNSGVLLIDARAYRATKSLNHFYSTLQGLSDKVRFPDQDVMNVAFHRKIRSLEFTWNAQISAVVTQRNYPSWNPQLADAIKDPAVVHFSSREKPWIADLYVPFGPEYKQYLQAFVNSRSLQTSLRCSLSYGKFQILTAISRFRDLLYRFRRSRGDSSTAVQKRL